jgi:hypothetical protein
MTTSLSPTSGTIDTLITIYYYDNPTYQKKTTLVSISSSTAYYSDTGLYFNTPPDPPELRVVVNSFYKSIVHNPSNNPPPGEYRLYQGDVSGSALYVGNFTIGDAPVICFKSGSKILCLEDDTEVEIPIENIKIGKLVKTLNDGYVPVKIVGKSSVYNSGDDERIKDRLYKLSKDKYEDLKEDLYLTGCHSILVDDITEVQRQKIKNVLGEIYATDDKYRLLACVDERAEPYKEKGRFDIYHLALESEDKNRNYGIYANGLLVESCFEKRIERDMKKVE